jgi:hypothetical protein
MSQDEPSGPGLDGVVADANAVGLEYVVIGGFSVIANGFLRATKDSDLLVPDGQETDEAILRFFDRIEASRLRDGKVLSREDIAGAEHLRVASRHGIVDVMRGGLPPLDFDTVAKDTIDAEVGAQRARIAGLRSIVAFKRLRTPPRSVETSKSWSPSTVSCRSSRSPGSTADLEAGPGRPHSRNRSAAYNDEGPPLGGPS